MDLSLSSRLEEWNSSTVAHSTSAIPCSLVYLLGVLHEHLRELKVLTCMCQNLQLMSIFVSFYLVVPSLPVAPTKAPPAPPHSPLPTSNPSIISSPRPFTAIPVPHWHVEKRTCLGSPMPASAFKVPKQLRTENSEQKTAN